jgi:hypothetical protein
MINSITMKATPKIILLIAGALGVAGLASATVLTFDDLPAVAIGTVPVPYDGLNLSCEGNACQTIDATLYNASYSLSGSGYTGATISSPNVLSTGSNSSPNTLKITAAEGGTFVFNSAYLTGAWRNGMSVSAVGKNGSTEIYSKSFTLGNAGIPTLATLNWTGVTSVTITASGGTNGPFSSYQTYEIAVDNLTYNAPVPPSISSLQPNSLDAGSAAFTLTVNGSQFVNGDTVEWNSVPLATTYESSSKLTAKVSAAEVAAAGSAAVTVVNTAGGKVASNPALFTIPLTSIVINSQTIKTVSGGYSITLNLRNSGFKPAMNISLNGGYLATSETLTPLPVDIASIAAGGTKTVTLSFPSAAGKAGEEEYLLLYGSYVGGGITLSSVETLP